MLICYLKRNYPDALRLTMDTDERRAVEMDRSIEGTPPSLSSSTTKASSQSGLDTSSAGDILSNPDSDSDEIEIGDLVEFYKAAKKCFDEDESFKEASRLEVVQLQSGRWIGVIN
jgi:hypothetical protein